MCEGRPNNSLPGTYIAFKQQLAGYIAFKKTTAIQRGASDRSLGFEDEDLGSSPRLVGRYCSFLLPKQAGELPKFLSSKPCE